MIETYLLGIKIFVSSKEDAEKLDKLSDIIMSDIDTHREICEYMNSKD